MHALDPDLLLKNKRGQIHKKIGLTRRRDFGAVMNNYTAFDAPDITWYAEGDGNAVERLLSSVQFIGKRRAANGFAALAISFASIPVSTLSPCGRGDRLARLTRTARVTATRGFHERPSTWRQQPRKW